MTLNEIITITIVLTAVFAYINHRLIKWPPTIGIMVLALASSVMLNFAGRFYPSLSNKTFHIVSFINFQSVLMNFMLSFLLFAGSVHIDAGKLKNESWPVVALATLGTVISTYVIGVMMFYLFGLFAVKIPFLYCLLFGALISPTDPIAVLGILKEAKIPASLNLKISGESLFNDGIAVVLFITISEISLSNNSHISIVDISKLFLQEAVGGLLFGTLLGYAGYWALRSIDDYKVEVLITLALVMGGYLMADDLHVSGPLAMVVTGVITGNKARGGGMSALTRDYLSKFWELIDEILNAILFLLVGMEMLVIKVNTTILLIGFIAISLVLMARFVSVAFPVFLLRHKIQFERHAVVILTWGGLRGGLSIAMALSLPAKMYHDEFLLITYVIVVFSILVQGLSIGKLAKKLQHS